MAKVTMTTNYVLPKTVNQLNKWEVVDYHENARVVSPYCEVTVAVYGVGQTESYCEKTMRLFNDQASGVMAINPTPADRSDSVMVNQVSIANAYTTYSAAFWANVTGAGTKAKHIAALQETIRTKAGAADGIVTADFAGT